MISCCKARLSVRRHRLQMDLAAAFVAGALLATAETAESCAQVVAQVVAACAHHYAGAGDVAVDSVDGVGAAVVGAGGGDAGVGAGAAVVGHEVGSDAPTYRTVQSYVMFFICGRCIIGNG